MIEPSGIVQRYKAFAMGKYSNQILERLGIVLEENEDKEDLQKQLILLIQSVVPSTKTDTSILVEIMSQDGIERIVISPA